MIDIAYFLLAMVILFTPLIIAVLVVRDNDKRDINMSKTETTNKGVQFITSISGYGSIITLNISADIGRQIDDDERARLGNEVFRLAIDHLEASAYRELGGEQDAR